MEEVKVYDRKDQIDLEDQMDVPTSLMRDGVYYIAAGALFYLLFAYADYRLAIAELTIFGLIEILYRYKQATKKRRAKKGSPNDLKEA